jgi:hypothetical protein
MADFATSDEEKEFGSFLDELEAEGEQAMAAAEREDQQHQKHEKAKKAEREEDGVVTKAEYMADKFLASASATEKTLFGIYRHGAETPDQIRRAIELARTNAAEAEKATSKEVEEQVEQKAAEVASEAYGVGPLANGSPARQPTAQEIFDRTREHAVKTRDTRALGSLFVSLPPDAE